MSAYGAGMSERHVTSAAALLDTMPFARTCGIELAEAGPERVTGFGGLGARALHRR